MSDNAPLLSWNSFEEDENPNVRKAAESLRNLDTTEAEAELDRDAKAHAERSELRGMGMVAPIPTSDLIAKPSTEPQVGTKGIVLSAMNIDYGNAKSALERAAIAVAEYNKQFVFGERVLAKNKRLINAQTDLNQLIPFKYSWAWSMYLESTNGHWMPPEIASYVHDEKNYPSLPVSDKKLVSRLVINYMYSQYIYPATMLVNLYRLSTNPEVRQYELRQTFEEQVFHHSLRHMVEIFDLTKEDILLHRASETAWRQRNSEILPYIQKLSDLSTSTAEPEEVGDFIVALATMYGGMRGLYHLIPMMQIWQANRDRGILNGVAENVKFILRDMNRQWDFGTRYINGIIEENPNTFTSSVVARVQRALERLHAYNIDLINADNDGNQNNVNELAYTSHWFMVEFLRGIGIDVPHQKVTPQYEGYIQMFKDSNKSNHDNAAASITGNAGGGLGDWD